ncbi:parathyroid hormone-like hormone a [Limanda limanda]|uniref:parathyroid hormone-like hormone a n=1 Tax=Limanda limanda TaxID=27771 RepID=UPI0029C7ADF8|nr:parathyroid hormone-like hormone a [Limanda limanda]
MFCSRKLLQQWCFALFLLCSPVPHFGRPIDALSSRMKRSVTHAQLMHDKGRALQDFKRRMWLQELLDEVHTAEVRDLPVRTTGAGAGSSGAGGGLPGGGLPGLSLGLDLSTTGSTMHSKPTGGTKNLPVVFSLEDEEGTNLPQETNKSPTFKSPGKKKKKGRAGKRRDGEKRKRRVRSVGRREEAWRSLLGLQGALLKTLSH